MGDTPEFTRTRNAAQVEQSSKWDLIAAIAEDAIASALPITSMDSQLAAKAAFVAVGAEYADRTIEEFCVVAKFDHEATATQRSTWRRHGLSIAKEFALHGWSQEATAEWLLGAHQVSWRAARKAVSTGAGPKPEPAPKPIDDAWREWLNAMNRVLMDGARLAERTDDENVELGAHSSIGRLIYERITERKLDAEIRSLLESVEVER